MDKANSTLKEDTLILQTKARDEQEKLLLLTRMYELQILILFRCRYAQPLLIGIPIVYKLPRGGDETNKFNNDIYGTLEGNKMNHTIMSVEGNDV